MSGHDLDVREGTPADLPLIAELLGASGLSAASVRLDAGRYWLAWDQGMSLVGVVGLEVQGTAALLRSLAVDPRFRGRGHGVSLVRHAMKMAGESGCTDVYAYSTGATEFFVRCGFVPASVAEAAGRLSSAPQVMHYRSTGALNQEKAWRTTVRSAGREGQ